MAKSSQAFQDPNVNVKIRIIVVLFEDVKAEVKIKKKLYDDWGLQAYVVQVSEGQLYQIQ